MNAFQEASAARVELDVLVLDPRTTSLLEQRRSAAARHPSRRRGWFVRRALLAADAAGLILAYLLAKLIASGTGSDTHPWVQFAGLVLALPLWVVAAKLYGLYDRDEERVDHSTIDDVVGVFQVVTLGAWSFFVASWLAGLASPHVPRLILFWLLAVIFVTSARGLARTIARRSPLYLQNTIIVGAGEVAVKARGAGSSFSTRSTASTSSASSTRARGHVGPSSSTLPSSDRPTGCPTSSPCSTSSG